MAIKGFVADVGGTNIRLTEVSPTTNQIKNIKQYKCKDFDSIADAILKFFDETEGPYQSACIAVACPVGQDKIDLTNNHWSFSVNDLKKKLNLNDLFMINDYTAIAMSIPSLMDNQVIKIGPGEAISKKPIAVCGPGTGLGVAMLLHHADQWVCLDGEGGHVDFAPQDELEDYLLQYLRKKYDHVSAERFITGPGLVNLYQGIKSYYKEKDNDLEPSEITESALNESDQRCVESLKKFCSLLGAFAGNLAITGWTAGGVYIAGGIAPKIVNFIKKSDFRKRFEEKGRFTESLKKFPTYIIVEQQPGLIGAAAYLKQKIFN